MKEERQTQTIELDAVPLLDEQAIKPLALPSARALRGSVLSKATDDATQMALLIELAIKSGQSITELVAAHKEILAMRAQQQYAEAMHRFSSIVPMIPKAKWAEMTSRRDPAKSWGFSYAPLEVIAPIIKPSLDACGLSYRFNMRPPQAGGELIETVCIVAHAGGHQDEASFWSPAGMNDAISKGQNMAASNKFNMRQALVMALGLVMTDNFDDETLLRETNRKPPAAVRMPERKAATSAPVNAAPASAEAPEPVQHGGRMASEAQCIMIRKRADGAGVRESDLLRKFSLESLEAMPMGRVDELLNYIKSAAP